MLILGGPIYQDHCAHGINDLINISTRPTLWGKQKPDQYNLYINKKKWLNTGSAVTIENP